MWLCEKMVSGLNRSLSFIVFFAVVLKVYGGISVIESLDQYQLPVPVAMYKGRMTITCSCPKPLNAALQILQQETDSFGTGVREFLLPISESGSYQEEDTVEWDLAVNEVVQRYFIESRGKIACVCRNGSTSGIHDSLALDVVCEQPYCIPKSATTCFFGSGLDFNGSSHSNQMEKAFKAVSYEVCFQRKHGCTPDNGLMLKYGFQADTALVPVSLHRKRSDNCDCSFMEAPHNILGDTHVIGIDGLEVVPSICPVSVSCKVHRGPYSWEDLDWSCGRGRWRIEFGDITERARINCEDTTGRIFYFYVVPQQIVMVPDCSECRSPDRIQSLGAPCLNGSLVACLPKSRFAFTSCYPKWWNSYEFTPSFRELAQCGPAPEIPQCSPNSTSSIRKSGLVVPMMRQSQKKEEVSEEKEEAAKEKEPEPCEHKEKVPVGIVVVVSVLVTLCVVSLILMLGYLYYKKWKHQKKVETLFRVY